MCIKTHLHSPSRRKLISSQKNAKAWTNWPRERDYVCHLTRWLIVRLTQQLVMSSFRILYGYQHTHKEQKYSATRSDRRKARAIIGRIADTNTLTKSPSTIDDSVGKSPTRSDWQKTWVASFSVHDDPVYQQDWRKSWGFSRNKERHTIHLWHYDMSCHLFVWLRATNWILGGARTSVNYHWRWKPWNQI